MTAQVRVCYPSSMAKDISQIAHSIMQEATREKNANAVALGRLGGLVGGKARAAKLSAKRRKEIAEKAVKTRWKK